jgi:hypothetical protein
MLSSRILRWAIAVSVCLHLLLLLTGRGYWSTWLSEDPEDDTIEVRLLAPPPPPPEPPKRVKPAKSSAKPQAEPRTPTPASPSISSSPEAGTTDSRAPADPAPAETAPPPAPLGRTLPGNGHMRFSITKGEGGFIVGRATHAWKIDGDRYELSSIMETVGIVSLFTDIRLGQTSIGKIDADGLHPERFLDNRKDGQFRSEFNWEQGTLTLSNGKVVPLTPGAQDLLSMFYQLSLSRLDGPEQVLMVTNGKKFERYVFRVEADVPLILHPQTDEPPIPTYHLSYKGRDEEGVEVWLARDGLRLPVKIRYVDRKGGVTEMYAEEFNDPGSR